MEIEFYDDTSENVPLISGADNFKSNSKSNSDISMKLEAIHKKSPQVMSKSRHWRSNTEILNPEEIDLD